MESVELHESYICLIGLLFHTLPRTMDNKMIETLENKIRSHGLVYVIVGNRSMAKIRKGINLTCHEHHWACQSAYKWNSYRSSRELSLNLVVFSLRENDGSWIDICTSTLFILRLSWPYLLSSGIPLMWDVVGIKDLMPFIHVGVLHTELQQVVLLTFRSMYNHR